MSVSGVQSLAIAVVSIVNLPLICIVIVPFLVTLMKRSVLIGIGKLH